MTDDVRAPAPFPAPSWATPEEIAAWNMSVASYAMRQAIRVHEAAGCARTPAGEVCWSMRYQAVAWLAHCLGITPNMLEAGARERLERYERECPCQKGADGPHVH